MSNNAACKMVAIYVISSLATLVLYAAHLHRMESKADAHYATIDGK